MAEMTFKTLAEKGDGVLIKRGGVWTYPGAADDGSGTNLRLPVDYVSDAEVQKALADGGLVGATHHPSGELLSVKLKVEGQPQSLMTTQAGTAEAGTELPPNSRPSLDAGATVMSSAEAEQAVTNAMKPVAEGANIPGRESDEKMANKEPVRPAGRPAR